MFKYTSQKQLSIFDFHTDFESKLSAENRRVKMEELFDRDKPAAVYAKNLSTSPWGQAVWMPHRNRHINYQAHRKKGPPGRH